MAAASAERPAIGCFGLTEPDFGSNPAGMRTTAPPRWRRLGAQRRENLDHQRQRGRRGRGVGARRRRASPASWWSAARPGFSTSDIHGKWSMRASVTSSLSLADCRVDDSDRLPGRQRPEGAARLPHAGALRHRLGRDRRRHGLLRNRPPVFHPAQAVRRPAHRFPPAGAGKTGLDDHRNHQGAVAGRARRAGSRTRASWSPRTSPC